jgi:hypothetical protein
MNDEQRAELAILQARVAGLVQGHTLLAIGATDSLALAPPPSGAGPADCVVLAFEWSRVARDDQDAYLADLRARSSARALLVIVDDIYVEGVSLPVARTDLRGNTFHRVTGADGVQSEIPKNYPSDSALRKRLGGAARDIRVERGEYYWLLTGRLK